MAVVPGCDSLSSASFLRPPLAARQRRGARAAVGRSAATPRRSAVGPPTRRLLSMPALWDRLLLCVCKTNGFSKVFAHNLH